MIRRLDGMVVLLGLSLSQPALAWAQTAPTTISAEAHFTEGSRLFAARAFAAAAREFERAYEASHEAELLFNLGRALEESGELRGALDAYQRFDQGMPATFDRRPVQTRMAVLGRRLAVEMARTAPRPSVPTNTSLVAPPLVSPRPHPGQDRGLERGGFPRPSAGALALLVGGGAVLATGVVLGSLERAALDGCRVESDVARCATPAALDRASQTPDLALAANVSFALGAAALAVGATWWLLAPTRRMSVGAGPGSVALAMRW